MYFSFLVFICCPSEIIAQHVDQKILDLRAKSVANIDSMIAGRTLKRNSLLFKVIPSSIKESLDPAVFYEYVLQEKKEAVMAKFKRFGVNIRALERKRQEYKKNQEKTKKCFAISFEEASKKLIKVQSVAIRKRARDVFELFTNSSIPLIARENDQTPACATDGKVLIDEKLFKKFKVCEQKYLFAHEIIHLLEKHNTEEKVLKILLKEKHGKLSSVMRRNLFELSRSYETIADIKGVLRGGSLFAKGYEGFAKKEVEEESDNEAMIINATTSSHPARRHRYEAAKLLKKELELLACVTKIK